MLALAPFVGPARFCAASSLPPAPAAPPISRASLASPERRADRRLARVLGDRPLRVLASGCLAGRLCGSDGTSYGEHAVVAKLFAFPNVKVIDFCPETFSFGTPRAVCNIYGGDGFDVTSGFPMLTRSSTEYPRRL
jgi:hypothetical protein